MINFRLGKSIAVVVLSISVTISYNAKDFYPASIQNPKGTFALWRCTGGANGTIRVPHFLGHIRGGGEYELIGPPFGDIGRGMFEYAEENVRLRVSQSTTQRRAGKGGKKGERGSRPASPLSPRYDEQHGGEIHQGTGKVKL